MANEPVLQTSYSDISRASWCARSWYLGTYRRLRLIKEPISGPLPFGTRYHLVLDHARKADREYDAGWLQAKWMELSQHEWDYIATKWGITTRTDAELKEHKLGHAMLGAYPTWLEETKHEALWEYVDSEHQYGQIITITMPDGERVELLLRGKSDVRERRRSDGAIFIRDDKTAANLAESTLDQQERSVQGPLYLWLERKEAPKDQWSAGVSYTMHRKVQHTATAKPPFFARLDVQIGIERMRAAQRNIIAKIARVIGMTKQLDAGAHPDMVAPYTVGWWCKSCPFKAPCDLMQRGYTAGAAAMLDEKYEQGDPFERYEKDAEAVDAML